MEDFLLSEEFKRCQTARRKGTTEENNAGQLNASPSERSGSRRTRSQIAPDWSAQDTLTLVNEKIAVERECGDAVSTFQKWAYVAENLTAMDVVRNVNQCRRKWESLLEEYKAIKGWERKSKGSAYWLLDIQGRERVGIPLDFDQEVYEAIDDFVKIQHDNEPSGSDPDTDPEAEMEVLNAKKSGPKKHWSRPTSHRLATNAEESVMAMAKIESSKKPHQTSVPHQGIIAASERILTREKKCASREAKPTKKPHHLSNSQKGYDMQANERMLTEDFEQLLVDAKSFKKPRHKSTARQEENGHLSTKKASKNSAEERKQLLAKRLRENAELINAIVAPQGDECDTSAADLMYVDSVKMREARVKAEKLISCLTDLANDLNLLHSEVEKS